MTVYLISCSNSPTDKAQSSVKSYLKENLKNSETYEPISFSQLDTLKKADTLDTKQISLYKITHIYSITNADKDKVKMTISFYLDKDLKVNEANTKSINGDYGTLTGNAYWKYNNYVGNKADAGAKIELYSLDTARGNLKYEASADVQGNYRIEKVLPGSYFLIVRSKNATDCPERHLDNIIFYSDYMKQLFGLDINKYKTQLDEIKTLDSTFSAILFDSDEKKYGGLSGRIDKYTAIEKEMRDKAEKLLEALPDDFKKKIYLFTGYGNAYDFTTIRIEEGKIENENTDFGITCI
jgi:hypothetical protein